jgi:BlaI family transcriptional regulator, penicillinase repressor
VLHPPRLHELESEIMDEIWSGGERSVRDVLQALNARSDAQRAYTTVMTVMHRLVGKQMLRRQRRGRHDVFVPTITREEYGHARAEVEVGELISEYGDVAFAHFAREIGRLDPERQEQIRRLARGD